MRIGREQFPHTWYNIGPKDTWLFLDETIDLGRPTSAQLSAGYYKSPMTLMNHVNKGLESMATDKVRAKMSYSDITQKITLHMTPGTQFTVPHRCALARMLGFDEALISSPSAHPPLPLPSAEALLPRALLEAIANADEHAYTHPSLSRRSIGRTPSVTVVAPPKETPTVKRPKTWWTWIKGSIPSTSTRPLWSLA